MSDIRRKSIITTFWVYIGFAVGFVNTYLFTRNGGFTESQYGLTSIFIAIGTIMYAFSNFGMPAYLYKFHPYYKAYVARKQNDQLTWAMLFPALGFLLVCIGGILLKDLVIRKFSENSPELVQYYNWIFPFGFSILVFNLLEAFAWSIHKPIVSTFLRETGFRLIITSLVFLFLVHVVTDYDLFIKLYAFTYGIIALFLFLYLYLRGEINFTFSLSKVTRRFFKRIVVFCSYIYGSTLIFMIAQFFDSLVIASLVGMSKVGVFTLASNITGLVQAPQRGAISASTGPIAQAWKDKDLAKLSRIYHRSALNLLIASLGIFILIWMNFNDAITVFNLREGYREALDVFILLGIAKVLDLGTGVNSQIIVTSVYWRFELISGVILLSLTIPLNYILVKQFGIIGAGITNIVSFGVYNTIRVVFLWVKFKMQPFRIQTLLTIFLAAACYAVCHFVLQDIHRLAGLVLRSASFLLLYLAGIYYLKLTPDFVPVIQTVLKRLGIKKKN